MILPGYTQWTFNHSLGGLYDRPVRAVCFHTTEGTTVAGAVSVYKSFQACPHLTVDPETHELVQHVPLNLSSYALRNLVGGCQTNSTGIIQVEIVGYAADTWAWSQERLQWLGTEVLKPILDAYPGIPHQVYSGVRMNCDQWNNWGGGLCGHAHVPENDHWDPGDLNLHAVLDYAIGDDIVTPEDIEAIAQRTADIILNERKITILNDAGGEESHSLFSTVGFDYEQDRRSTALLRTLDKKFDALAKVAITTEPPGP
jgi:hypothetical protein